MSGVMSDEELLRSTQVLSDEELLRSARPRTAPPRLTPQQAALDIGRGILGTPVDVYGLLGRLAGSEGMQQSARNGNAWLDRNVTPQAEFGTDPVRAALQFGGSALIPLPGAGLAGVGAKTAARLGATGRVGQAVGAGAGRLLEVATPGTSGYRAGNIALNAGASIGIGAGIEAIGDVAQQEQAQGRVLSDAELLGSTSLTPNGGRGAASMFMDALPWIVGGLAVLGAGTAASRYYSRAGREADAANIGGAAQPGTQRGPDIGPNVGEAAEAGIFNNTQVLQNRIHEAVRDRTITRELGDDLATMVQLQTREAVNNDVTTELMRTGHFGHGVSTEAPVRLLEDIASLTPQQRRLFNDLMSAADEHDVRVQNIHSGKVDSSGEPQANALSSRSYADLKRMIADGRADPQVQQLEARYRVMTNALLDYAERAGVFSRAEVNNMRAMGPNYVHRMMSEETIKRNEGAGMPLTQGTENNSPFTARNRGKDSGPQTYQDPMVALEDGIRQSVDFIRRNEAIRGVADALGNKGYRGIGATRVVDANTKPAQGYVGIAYRGAGGKRMMLELEPSMAAAVMPYPRSFIPILNGSRIFMQNVTTGPVGALFGNLQAPASAAMGALTASVNAPSQLRMGWLDQAVRHLTGNKVNIRQLGVVDPTYFAQVLVESTRLVADHAAQAFSESANRLLARNGWAASIIGPARLQYAAQISSNYYRNSLLHYMREQGLIAQGIAYGANERAMARNIANLSPEYARTMPYGGAVPSITDIRKLSDLEEYAAKTGNRAIPGALRNTWNNFSRFLDLVSNAPQAAIYRQNRAQFVGRERTLAGIARLAVGDPAQYGGFKAVQNVTSALPYQNIAMQAAHQTFKAIQREPVAASLRLGTLATMTGMAMIVSAIEADEDAVARGEQPSAVAHLVTRDSRDAASAFRLYIPGTPPEMGFRVPIDGALAPAFSAVLGALQGMFDLDNPDFYTGRYAPLRDSIKRIMESSDRTRFAESFGRMGFNLPTPPIAQAGAALMGGDARNIGAFATGPEVRPLRDADGFSQDRILRDPVNRYVATVLENAFGLGGQAALDLARTFGYTGSITAAAAQWKQNATGAARMAPFVTGTEVRVGGTDAVGETVRRAEAKLLTIRQNMSEVLLGPGTLGSLRSPQRSQVEGGRMGVPEDIRPILVALNAASSGLRPLQQQRDRITQQMRDVVGSAQMRADPEAMRRRQNELAIEIRGINNQLHEQINRVEQQLSAQTGRRVSIADIDPQKGLSQFPELR